jgi:hypothetical protein
MCRKIRCDTLGWNFLGTEHPLKGDVGPVRLTARRVPPSSQRSPSRSTRGPNPTQPKSPATFAKEKKTKRVQQQSHDFREARPLFTSLFHSPFSPCECGDWLGNRHRPPSGLRRRHSFLGHRRLGERRRTSPSIRRRRSPTRYARSFSPPSFLCEASTTNPKLFEPGSDPGASSFYKKIIWCTHPGFTPGVHPCCCCELSR